MKSVFLIVICLAALQLRSQHTLSVIVKSKSTSVNIEDAIVAIPSQNKIANTDSSGYAILVDIPSGERDLFVSMLGYFRKKIKLTFPLPTENSILVELEEQEEELEEITIVSSRNTFSEENSPRRVEVISEDEVEERANDKPSDVSHLVREQPGVQVQRTSSTSGTMNIRLQGLNGRYVQVLKDGFPLFGGFASVISTNQIPPIDIRQVEIIKGPSSTLFGGDAIAGVINLISKTPTEAPIYDLMFNVESAAAMDAGLYFSQKKNKVAYSLLGLYRYQKAKDWDDDNYSETPKLQRFNLSPQLYFDVSDKCKLNIGLNYTHENRQGGAMPNLQGEEDSMFTYFDKNNTDHVAFNGKTEFYLPHEDKITLRTAFNFFQRSVEVPRYLFNGIQLGSATEVNYHLTRKKHDAVVGVDFRSDNFMEGNDSSQLKRNYNYYTVGLFAQYIYSFSDRTNIEAGLRLDYNHIYKVNALPHVAFRQKWNEVFTTKLNVGMGYKLPTIFQDASENRAFINVLPISRDVKPELSLGGTVDLRVNFPNINGLQITLHQLYFLTHVFRTLTPIESLDLTCTGTDCMFLKYQNINGNQQSKGIESGLNFSYRGFKASFVYTLTDNNLTINKVRSAAPITSKHIIYLLAGYEIKMFTVDLDCYYFSPVKFSDGKSGQNIWEIGINTQLSFKHVLIFANLENILNIRQTSFGPIVRPGLTPDRPEFSEIYAPLEGPLLNVGFKLRLGAFSKTANSGGIEKLSNIR